VIACGTPVLDVNNPMPRALITPELNGLLWQPHQETLEQALHVALQDREILKRISEASAMHL